MTIEALTIISPRPNPVMYTSLQTIAASGGVYSPDIDKVQVKNRNTTQGNIAATLTHITGNEYEWTATGINVASIGLNTIDITAYDSGGESLLATFQIFVDYTAPTVASHIPANNITNVATNQAIQVTFSELMSLNDIFASLAISPEIEGAVWIQGATAKVFSLNYSGYLAPYTQYTITVSTLAKDTLANVDAENVYIQAGNSLAAPKTIVFTTGAGIGANDPTRRGFSPPEEILEKEGSVDNIELVAKGTHKTINPSVYDEWLNFQYLVRYKPFEGIEENLGLQNTGYYKAINPPGILNPFRYKPFDGFVEQLSLTDTGLGIKINDIIYNEHVTTTYAVLDRDKAYEGIIMGLADLETFDHIPLVLSYQLDNKVDGSTIAQLDSRFLSMTWDNPRDKEGARLYYRIELSKHPSFYRTITFDSTHNSEAFWTSNNDDFVPMTSFGAPSGIGQTRFTCPTVLQGGIWYVRLTVGNKKRSRA